MVPLPTRFPRFAVPLFLLFAPIAVAADLRTDIDRMADQLEPRVIEWRRDIHQNPELGNREFRTAGKVAEHLKALGLFIFLGGSPTGTDA
ncbi:MAG TPA: hypothetical protein VES94_06025 [Burkholderiales bacterium]|nr:hypothetical protein [Burkholderiales bacterium]